MHAYVSSSNSNQFNPPYISLMFRIPSSSLPPSLPLSLSLPIVIVILVHQMGSLAPLWSRQIPYTMAKFFFFERIVQMFYDRVFTEPKESYSKNTQLGVTFSSGYLAGVICAIVSHPADTLVSLKGKASNKGKTFGQMAREAGATTLLTKGLGTRVLMIGTLTGLQWWLYDSFKAAMGMGTTGGGSRKKEASK
eukprot:GHVU01083705.1.p1 GENE.GHVU01083705.1~~GHVU01083705.1.p1  ORF type:complete len:193 (-),score=37.04 GHVU01083705.1:2-580(-)